MLMYSSYFCYVQRNYAHLSFFVAIVHIPVLFSLEIHHFFSSHKIQYSIHICFIRVLILPIYVSTEKHSSSVHALPVFIFPLSQHPVSPYSSSASLRKIFVRFRSTTFSKSTPNLICMESRKAALLLSAQRNV